MNTCTELQLDALGLSKWLCPMPAFSNSVSQARLGLPPPGHSAVAVGAAVFLYFYALRVSLHNILSIVFPMQYMI